MENFPSLTYKIETKAFRIFQVWTNEVKAIDPTFIPNVENEEEIVLSVKKRILDCLKKIRQKKDRNYLTDWCIGFLKGYLISTLSTNWSRRYYKKPFKYQKALWLKSMISVLDVDDEFTKKVNRIYILLAENNFALENATDFSKNRIDESKILGHQILSDLSYKENWKIFKTPLIEDMLKSLIEEDQENDEIINIPEIENFFSYSEFEELILKNPYKS